MIYPESISVEEIELLETAAFNGPIEVVKELDEEYAEAIEYLETQSVIGFDTETRPSFLASAPRNKMSLLQLCGEDKAYLFRLHSLGLPYPLAKILSDPTKIKVGAAVHDDLKGLQGYRKFQPRGFVDLQKMAEKFGIKEKSVKKMAAIILGLKISKAQQLSNWEAPQLSGAQLKYAATDAWVCLQMYLKLNSEDAPVN